MITQEQYDTLKQPIREIYLKVNILDEYFNIIGEITGNVVNGKSSISATSDIRRTFDIDMIITDNSLDLEPDGMIWMYTIVQPMIGVKSIKNNRIVWYNQGIGVIDAPSWQFKPETRTLSFSVLDLVSLLDGTYSGEIPFAYDLIYNANENVRKAINDTIMVYSKHFKGTQYQISECTNVDGSIVNIPNDITFSKGITVWGVLKELRDILPNYQMYYDIDGVFHYETIPFESDPFISIDDNLWKYVVLSEDTNVPLREIYNDIYVYGKSHNVENFLGDLSKTSNYLDASAYTQTLTDKLLYGFTTEVKINQPYIKVGTGSPIRVLNEDGTFAKINSTDITGLVDNYFVVRYDATGTYNGVKGAFIFLGNLEARGHASETNPESPFHPSKIGGLKTKVYSGGDYENIYSNDLCEQRAKWEVYRSCRMNDTIKLTCVPIYFIDVNMIVEYTSQRTNEKSLYLVQSVSNDWSEGGSMSITLQKYFPYYF